MAKRKYNKKAFHDGMMYCKICKKKTPHSHQYGTKYMSKRCNWCGYTINIKKKR